MKKYLKDNFSSFRMRNQIKFNYKDNRENKVRSLLEIMDADIVDLSGGLPVVSVELVDRLTSGGSIYISVPNSQSCWLESNCEKVSYHPKDQIGSAHIMCYYETGHTKKHSTKIKNYRFHILLAGIRPRSD
jgi:hypothetical protein